MLSWDLTLWSRQLNWIFILFQILGKHVATITPRGVEIPATMIIKEILQMF